MAYYRVCLVGASGRMGQEIIKLTEEQGSVFHGQVEITCGIVESNAKEIGHHIPGVRFPLSDNWQPEFAEANIIIDFSSPAGTRLALELARQHKLPAVICTTGLSDEDEKVVVDTSELVPLLRATNTSIGVNVLRQVVQKAAELLGASCDIEILELHHGMKRDAPSGTALQLAQDIANVRHDIVLEEKLVTGRFGITGQRSSNELGVMALRGGDNPGEHTVYFIGHGERIEITHRSLSRRIFAEGALRATKWLLDTNNANVQNGLFSMFDILG